MSFAMLLFNWTNTVVGIIGNANNNSFFATSIGINGDCTSLSFFFRDTRKVINTVLIVITVIEYMYRVE